MHDTDALGPGRWIVRRGIKVRIGPRPADDPSYFEPLAAPSGRIDVDRVQVELAVAGHARPDMNLRERRVATRILHARGLSDSEIADHLGCADRTVLRNRKLLGLPSNYPQFRAAPLEEVAA